MDLKRVVNTRIWADPWFEELEPDEKLVWIYLLTNQQTNMLGIYEVSLKRISTDTGVAIERVRKAFEGFTKASKGVYLEEGWVILFNWIKNQKMNPNMQKSVIGKWETLPESVKTAIFNGIRKGLKGFERLSEALQSLPKIEIEIEREIEIEIEEETELISPEGDVCVNHQKSEVASSSYRMFVDPSGSEDFESHEAEKKKVAPKKKSQAEIPELEEFLIYTRDWMEKNGKDFEGKRVQIETKYETWKNAGWKDGFGKPIKDWKGKIRSTEPYLKADAKSNSIIRQAIREPQPGKGFGRLLAGGDS